MASPIDTRNESLQCVACAIRQDENSKITEVDVLQFMNWCRNSPSGAELTKFNRIKDHVDIDDQFYGTGQYSFKNMLDLQLVPASEKTLKEINIDLKKLVNNNDYLSKFLIKEIKEINETLSEKIKTRRSKVNTADDYQLDIEIDEFTEIEKFNVLVTKDNLLKKVKDYSEDNKEKDNNIRTSIPIASNQKLLIFLSSGKALTLDPNLLPGGKASPKSYIELINVGVDEKLIAVFNANTQKKLLLVSKFGKGFISITEKMITNQRKGKNIINLKNNDQLINVHYLENNHLALVSKNEKLLIFETSSLPTLHKGSGVQLMKIKDKDFIVDSCLFDLGEGLLWTKSSKHKHLKDIDFWIGKRAQVGKKVPKGFNKNLKF